MTSKRTGSCIRVQIDQVRRSPETIDRTERQDEIPWSIVHDGPGRERLRKLATQYFHVTRDGRRHGDASFFSTFVSPVSQLPPASAEKGC